MPVIVCVCEGGSEGRVRGGSRWRKVVTEW